MNDNNQIQVSIVIPAYNEMTAIAKVIDQVNEAMRPTAYKYEIIIVDDCSSDNTAQTAESKGAKVLKRLKRGGSGASRKTGIRSAKGDIIVMLDADGTYECSDIPEMLKFFPEYDQVIGARTSEQGTLKFLRAPAKRIICAISGYLVKTYIPDINSGLRAFKKDVMTQFLWMIPDGFSCVTSMTLAFLSNGFFVKWIPTKYYPRIGKSKFNPIVDTYNLILTLTRIIMYFNPLRIFLPLSFILFTIGLAKSFYDRYFVVNRLQLSDILIILISFLIGILGLMSDLIVSIGKSIHSRLDEPR